LYFLPLFIPLFIYFSSEFLTFSFSSRTFFSFYLCLFLGLHTNLFSLSCFLLLNPLVSHCLSLIIYFLSKYLSVSFFFLPLLFSCLLVLLVYLFYDFVISFIFVFIVYLFISAFVCFLLYLFFFFIYFSFVPFLLYLFSLRMYLFPSLPLSFFICSYCLLIYFSPFLFPPLLFLFIYIYIFLSLPPFLRASLLLPRSSSTSHSLAVHTTGDLISRGYGSTQLLHLTDRPCNLSPNFVSPFIESLFRTTVSYARETVNFLFELMH
jgi:hypothetical protein